MMFDGIGTVRPFGVFEVHVLKGQVDVLWRHLTRCPYVSMEVKDLANTRDANKHSREAANAAARIAAPVVNGSRHSSSSSTPSSASNTLPPEPPSAPGAAQIPFFGETEARPMPSTVLSEFHADLCCLLVAGNVAWRATEHPYWRYFFSKWVPGSLLPGRDTLSGRILDAEVGKANESTKSQVQGRYGTGQCDGWKNKAKKSLITDTMNVKYKVCFALDFWMNHDGPECNDSHIYSMSPISRRSRKPQKLCLELS